MFNHKNLAVSYGILMVPVIAAFILVMSFSNIVTASDDKQPTGNKYFKAVEIEEGDTLWSIAKQNITGEWDSVEEYVKEIRTLNGLATDNIHIGNYISIPYYLPE